ncbi:hypothetical protein U1Q18_036740 [Sarracenia purpurea var. burkii]
MPELSYFFEGISILVVIVWEVGIFDGWATSFFGVLDSCLAKEAEALGKTRADNEARTELDSPLRDAEERETMLVQALEELRQTLSIKEQQVHISIFYSTEIAGLEKIYYAETLRIFKNDIKLVSAGLLVCFVVEFLLDPFFIVTPEVMYSI